MPNVKFVSSLSEDLIRECMASGMTYICDARTTEAGGKARPIEEDILVQMRQCFVEYFQIPQLAVLSNTEQIIQDLINILENQTFKRWSSKNQPPQHNGTFSSLFYAIFSRAIIRPS